MSELMAKDVCISPGIEFACERARDLLCYWSIVGFVVKLLSALACGAWCAVPQWNKAGLADRPERYSSCQFRSVPYGVQQLADRNWGGGVGTIEGWCAPFIRLLALPITYANPSIGRKESTTGHRSY